MPNITSTLFEGTSLRVITKDGQQYLTGTDISKALGYKSTDAATKIYRRNQDEFDGTMTLTTKLGVKGQKQTVRVFNKRGCHLVGMFANTSKAKEFRKWALDTLEAETSSQAPLDNSTVPALAEPQLTPELQAQIEAKATEYAIAAHAKAKAKLTKLAHEAQRRFPQNPAKQLQNWQGGARPLIFTSNDLLSIRTGLVHMLAATETTQQIFNDAEA